MADDIIFEPGTFEPGIFPSSAPAPAFTHETGGVYDVEHATTGWYRVEHATTGWLAGGD